MSKIQGKTTHTQDFSSTIEKLDNVYEQKSVNNHILTFDSAIQQWKGKNLEDYGEYDHGSEILTFSSNVWATASYNIMVYWIRNGNLLTLLIPMQIHPTKVPIFTGNIFCNIGAFYRPQKYEQYFVRQGINVGFPTNAIVTINSTQIKIYNNSLGQPFSSLAGANSGFYNICISYMIADSTSLSIILPSFTNNPLIVDPVIADTLYINSHSIVYTDETKTNFVESPNILTNPAANSFQITNGSVDFLVNSDCEINQQLNTSASPSFSGLNVNTINERTLNNGINIENLLLKDGALKLTSQADPSLVYPYIYSFTGDILRCGPNNIILGSTSSIDNSIPRYDGLLSKIKGSSILIDDLNNITGVNSLQINATTIINGFLDEDDFHSDDNQKCPTQQSTKYYIDNKLPGSIGNGNDDHICRYSGTNIVQDSKFLINDSGMLNCLSTTGILDLQTDGIHSIYIKNSGSIRIGHQALNSVSFDNTEILKNISIGQDSMRLSTGSDCISIGYKSGESVGSNSVCIGNNSQNGASIYENVIAIGSEAASAADYYIQFGKPNDVSHSAVSRCYSQIICNESWRDGNSDLASIDTTGNIIKSSFSPPVNNDVNVTWKGAINDYQQTISYKKFNGLVTLKIPAFNGTGKNSSSTIDNTGTELNVDLRPSSDTFAYMYVQNDGIHCLGSILVRSTGILTLYRLQLSGTNLVYSNFSSNVGNNGPTHTCVVSYYV